MDLKEKIKLHRQTIEAIEACEKDKGIRLQGSNSGLDWFGSLELTGSFRAYTFYRIAEPEPKTKKVKYYRPIIFDKNDDLIDTAWGWRRNKENFKISSKIIGWDERPFDIPEEE